KPSRRGFRRDLRGVAHAALELAQALRRLAGAEEAAIRGRADGGDRQAEAEADAADRGRAAAKPANHARRALPQEAPALFGRCAAGLRPRPAAHLLQQSAAPALAAGDRLHPAPPRRYPAAGFQMDRRIPAHARPGARRNDRALPRIEVARGRPRAAVANRFHRAVDGQDGALALQPVAATVDRPMRSLRVLMLTHPDLVPPDSLK